MSGRLREMAALSGLRQPAAWYRRTASSARCRTTRVRLGQCRGAVHRENRELLHADHDDGRGDAAGEQHSGGGDRCAAAGQRVDHGHLGTAAGIDSITCTGETATSLTGCSGGSGSVAKGSDVGAPGAATAPYSQLAPIGEGKNKPKSLYGNNEDLTVARVAYTYDGVHFTDLGTVSGLNDPTSNSASTLRFVGSRGTVITNPDGSLGLLLSGAYASDDDSDAFDQIFHSSSRDGQHWSAPTALLHTDYTFRALAAQTTGAAPLGISGYYPGGSTTRPWCLPATAT